METYATEIFVSSKQKNEGFASFVLSQSDDVLSACSPEQVMELYSRSLLNERKSESGYAIVNCFCGIIA